MSVNKVILLGHVGRDPEIRYPQRDLAIASFPLATNERVKGGGERTEWHRIVMTGRNAELAERYIRRGTRLYLEGKLCTRLWVDKAQQKHNVTEIYVDTFELLGRGEGGATPQERQE